MANYLNKVLSGLHRSDVLLTGRIDTLSSSLTSTKELLSGLISSAFANDKIVIGDGSKLVSSQYSIDSATTSAAFTTGTLSTKIANEEAVKAYVNDKITELGNSTGVALTGITRTGDALTIGDVSNKSVNITLAVDGKTIGQDTTNGLKSLLTLSGNTNPGGDYAAVYALVDNTGATIGQPINIPKDQFLTSAYYAAGTEELVFQFKLSGNPASSGNEVRIPASDLVHEYEGGDGIFVANTPSGKSTISGVIDSSSESFLTVGADGFKLAGVQTAIDNAKRSLWDSANTSGAIYDALNGYTSGDAVANKFTEIDNKLDAAGIGAALTSGKVLSSDADGKIAASNFEIGATDKTGFGSASELAVEAAVTGYVADQVSGAVSGVTNANQFVFGADAGSVKTTGKTLLAHAADNANGVTAYANEDSMTDSVIPTAAAVKDYVNDGLTEIMTNVNALISDLGGTPIPTT